MVQLAAVDTQNPCRLYRVNLFTYTISRCNYDLYEISPKRTNFKNFKLS